MVTKFQEGKLEDMQPSPKQDPKSIPDPLTKPHSKELTEPRSLSDLTRIYLNRPEQGVVKTATDEAPSVFLSRFGLKTPEALDKFLRTPAGKEVITEMTQELANQEAYAENNRLEQREHDLLMRRIKVALFLWYLDKEAHAADKVKEWIREGIEKSLDHKKTNQKPQTAEEAARQSNLQDAIKSYTNAIAGAQTRQSSLKSEEELLMTALTSLEKRSEQLTAKYDLYEAHVEDEHFDSYMNDDGSINIDAINTASERLETDMAALHAQMDDIIDDEDALAQFVQKQNSLNLQLATLHDMRAVHEGSKYYADEHGAKVNALQEAAFVLNKEDKLIYDNGQYYLLKPSQSWDTVKDNPEERVKAMQQAKQNFDRSKSEIMTVKKVVNHNRGLEHTVHNERVEDKRMALSANTAEQRLVENQIRLLQSARSEAQAALTSLSLALRPSMRPMVSPTVTTTPSSTAHSAPTPRPSPQPILSYKEELDRLKQAKELTQTDLLALAAKAPGANQANARAFIQNLFASGGAGLSRMTAPYRDQILNRMAQFGIQTPAIQQQQQTDPTSTYKTPTPFNMSMRPYPYKGG